MKNKTIINVLQKIALDVEPVSNAKIAASITKRGKIISIGTNKNKTHPMQAKFAKHDLAIYQHAELSALINYLREEDIDDLRKCDIFVVRTKKNGDLAMAKPCKGCQKALLTFGIKNIYYSDQQGKIICETLN
jgi:deoxycytidylate deaminase